MVGFPSCGPMLVLRTRDLKPVWFVTAPQICLLIPFVIVTPLEPSNPFPMAQPLAPLACGPATSSRLCFGPPPTEPTMLYSPSRDWSIFFVLEMFRNASPRTYVEHLFFSVRRRPGAYDPSLSVRYYDVSPQSVFRDQFSLRPSIFWPPRNWVLASHLVVKP